MPGRSSTAGRGNSTMLNVLMPFLVLLSLNVLTVVKCTVMVNLPSGFPVYGMVNEEISVFLGIQYAKAATGSLRWSAPRPYMPQMPENMPDDMPGRKMPHVSGNMTGDMHGNMGMGMNHTIERNMTEKSEESSSSMGQEKSPVNMTISHKHPPYCPQLIPNSWVPDPNAMTSEDCLHLNIYAPNATSGPYPVLVFIHGGNWKFGGASSYDGSALAARGVIVVIPNYRLGPLGFLMSRGGTFVSNPGLRDMLEALKWVKHNIAAFGGDVNNIVLAGHETGAESVTFLMTSPLAKGLFHRTIAMGGVGPFGEYAWDNPERPMNDAIDSMAEVMGCPKGEIADHLVCLRRKHYNEIVRANIPTTVSVPLHQWRPRVDGTDFPHFMNTWKSNRVAQIPLLIGSDGVLDVRDVPVRSAERMTASSYDKALNDILSWAYPNELLPLLKDTVNFSYREWNMPQLSPYLRRYINQMLGDMLNTGVTKASQMFSKQIDTERSNATLYRYVFNYRSPALTTLSLEHEEFTPTLTPWASIALLFGERNILMDNSTWSETDWKVSGQLTTLWIEFIKNGQPENEGIYWPAYNHTTEMYLKIDSSMSSSSYYRQRDVYFWDSLRRSLVFRVDNVKKMGVVQCEMEPYEGPYYIATWVLLGTTAFLLILAIFLVALMIHKSSDDYDMTTTPTVKYIAD